MTWQPIETAPKDGTAVLLAYEITSNEVHGLVPWKAIPVVIGWWENDGWENGWRICFMYDGSADSFGASSQFFTELPPNKVTKWMPLPTPPSP